MLNATRWDLPDGWQQGHFNGFVLSWDPTVTARLRKWHESGRVEIRWLTTWSMDADRLLAEPMGLPRGLRTYERADAGPSGFAGPWGGRSGWWKLDVARTVAEEEPDRRIVWIDDDLAEQAAHTGEWLAAHPHVLVVAPDLYVGLTHEQLDEIEAWLCPAVRPSASPASEGRGADAARSRGRTAGSPPGRRRRRRAGGGTAS